MHDLFQFAQARQKELVLLHTILDSSSRGNSGQFQTFVYARGQRLFAVNMLSGAECCANAVNSQRGCLRVKINQVLCIGETFRQVGAPAADTPL